MAPRPPKREPDREDEEREYRPVDRAPITDAGLVLHREAVAFDARFGPHGYGPRDAGARAMWRTVDALDDLRTARALVREAVVHVESLHDADPQADTYGWLRAARAYLRDFAGDPKP